MNKLKFTITLLTSLIIILSAVSTLTGVFYKLPENYLTSPLFVEKFLYEFGRIPKEGDVLDYRGHKFMVEKMKKRHINLLRIVLERIGGVSDEGHRHK